MRTRFDITISADVFKIIKNSSEEKFSKVIEVSFYFVKTLS